MMKKDWYQKALEKPITPENLRDALIECYMSVHHCAFKKQVVPKEAIILQIKNVFRTVGADFDHPTKKDLENVVEEMRHTLCAIIDGKDVETHYKQMKDLIKRL
ncbi:MAG: hypothetical protein J7K68_06125 [Candidatus Diapherotrites archaeon]|nr:hypothetical protein [Candidatus Diapherotrites archaeon]